MKTIKQKALKRLTPKTDSLTREQRRRIEREKLSGEATYTLTRAQIDKIKDDATQRALHQAFRMMIAFPVMAVRNQYGFQSKAIKRMVDDIFKFYHDYENGFITLEDIDDIIKHETGYKILD